MLVHKSRLPFFLVIFTCFILYRLTILSVPQTSSMPPVPSSIVFEGNDSPTTPPNSSKDTQRFANLVPTADNKESVDAPPSKPFPDHEIPENDAVQSGEDPDADDDAADDAEDVAEDELAEKKDASDQEDIVQEAQEAPLDRSRKCRTDSVSRNTDPNHNNAHQLFWTTIDPETVRTYQSQWKAFMARERNKPYPSKAFHGRGIVLVAGNSDTYQRALTAIYLLRHYKCTLPVEIWHMDDEAPTLAMKQQLKSLNAVARDLTDAKLIRPAQRRTGNSKQFQIKPAAIINSEFEQVLYLDSDNVPTGDPSFLFETPEYKTGGALFWPDYWKTNADNAIFKVLDIDCDDEWEQESGQMVIHKKKAWHALQLAWFMNHHHGIYYQFLNGDKDTFRFAWKTFGQSYYMNPVFLAMAGTEEATGDFCGHTMLQFAPPSYATVRDAPLFVHANLLKITDKVHFIEQDAAKAVTERPWRAIKQYTNSKGQTWLQPRFYVSYEGRACMDFSAANGEPATEVLDFDQVLPEFQHLYFEFGGIGGETRL